MQLPLQKAVLLTFFYNLWEVTGNFLEKGEQLVETLAPRARAAVVTVPRIGEPL